jgi:hypothetical protein
MARLHVAADLRLPLPGLVIGIDDIKMPARRRKNLVGPFLIISRACGLAVDARTHLDPGVIPHLWAPPLFSRRVRSWAAGISEGAEQAPVSIRRNRQASPEAETSTIS